MLNTQVWQFDDVLKYLGRFTMGYRCMDRAQDCVDLSVLRGLLGRAGLYLPLKFLLYADWVGLMRPMVLEYHLLCLFAYCTPHYILRFQIYTL